MLFNGIFRTTPADLVKEAQAKKKAEDAKAICKENRQNERNFRRLMRKIRKYGWARLTQEELDKMFSSSLGLFAHWVNGPDEDGNLRKEENARIGRGCYKGQFGRFLQLCTESGLVVTHEFKEVRDTASHGGKILKWTISGFRFCLPPT